MACFEYFNENLRHKKGRFEPKKSISGNRLNISTFDVSFFKKTYSNLARECEISDNNRKKLDES